MRLRWICVTGLLLATIAGATIAQEKQVAKVPKEVQQADKVIIDWLKGLKGQTDKEIRKALGDPAEETTWLNKGNKEPLLKYKLGESTSLSLYFFDERVVTVSLQLLPLSEP